MAGLGSYLDVLQALSGLPQTSGGGLPVTPGINPAAPPPLSIPSTPIEAPPPAPTAAADPTIAARYLSALGPAPVAPEQQKFGVLDKIFAALGGFSAGMQGRGGEYVTNLQNRLDQPGREFQARQDAYNQNKTNLGIRGLEAEQADVRRRTDQTQEQANRQFDLDVKERARKAGFEDQMAIAKFQEAAQLEQDARRAREQQERDARAEESKKKETAGKFAQYYGSQGAPAKIAKALGDYYGGMSTTLPPEAEKWESAKVKLDEARAAKLAGGGGGARGGGGGGGEFGGPAINAVLSDGRTIPYYKGLPDDIAKGAFGQGVAINNLVPRVAAGPQGPDPGAFAPGAAGPATPTTPVSDAEIADWRAKGIPEKAIKEEIARRGRPAGPVTRTGSSAQAQGTQTANPTRISPIERR